MQFSTSLTLAALSATAFAQYSYGSGSSSSGYGSSSGSSSGSSGSSSGYGSSSSSSGSNVNVHVVTVGNANGSLSYWPDNIVAAKGDMVQFQFMPKNHTVTQSNFDNPCQPISMHSNITGVFSGFMPVAADATNIPTYTILLNDTKPMWIYCSQGKHCQAGMSMVINQNTTANSTRSLDNYKNLAKGAAANLAPGAPADGTASSTPATAATAAATGTSTSSSSTSTSSTVTTNGAMSALKVPQAISLVAALVLGVALTL